MKSVTMVEFRIQVWRERVYIPLESTVLFDLVPAKPPPDPDGGWVSTEAWKRGELRSTNDHDYFDQFWFRLIKRPVPLRTL